MNVVPVAEFQVTERGSRGARLAVLRELATSLGAQDMIKFALNSFHGKLAIVSSFGAESVVLLGMVAKIAPQTPVIFLNTGKLFGETLRYRDQLQDVLGLTDIRSIGPDPKDREAHDPKGDLWSHDPDACCNFRKTVPLRWALTGFEAIITGRKRFQTVMRTQMEKVEIVDGRFCFNPLAEWSLPELVSFIDENALPHHPLANDGYPSIGCVPCTRRLKAGENYRDGRWSGFDKIECGIHEGVNGDGI